jgi:ABC-type polysaccharide/polyol phosphate transport system ATPase subunit
MSGANEMAIRVANLSKMFKMYSRPADMFWELLTGRQSYRPFWALRDISFEVCRGQVVGIMGRNGAGKSTLLKIITGTLDHTGGSISVKGRISSILELGTGFHPEYSGRENIYLGGLMVGLTREEILGKMDWIIQFSELEDFIDQPFKTYSTGMQARLTFSTAVCIDPDVLIIDEALSVGDAKFQRKSFGKIEEFRKAGRTILLVSHNANTINSFCDLAILLESGRIFDQGEPHRISQVYYKLLFSRDLEDQPAPRSGPNAEELERMPPEIKLDANGIVREKGYAWRGDLSGVDVEGDTSGEPERSFYALVEDDAPLHPEHCLHDQIRQYGKGAYSHWGKSLLFSTSDNTDPRTNGRTYSLKRKDVLPARAEAAPAAAPGVSPDPITIGASGLAGLSEREALRRLALQKLGLDEAYGQKNPHQSKMGNGKAEILDFGIQDEEGNRAILLNSGAKYTLFMRTLFYEDVEAVTPGFLIRDIKGVDMFGTTTRVQQSAIRGQIRGDLVEARMKVTMRLTNGIYFLTFGVSDPYSETDVQYDLRYDALQFEVSQKSGIFATSVVDMAAQPIEERIITSLAGPSQHERCQVE